MSIGQLIMIIITAPIPELVWWILGICVVIGLISGFCSAIKTDKKGPQKTTKVYGKYGYKEIKK